MKKILALLAAAVVLTTVGCVTVKHDEPATTRTTTVTTPAPAVSTSTTTY
jgi:hypothetical protein